MSFKRMVYTFVRTVIGHWMIFCVVAFLFTVFAIRFALHTPSKKPQFRNEEDYADGPSHRKAHRPRHRTGFEDEDDNDETIVTSTIAERKAPEIRRVFVSSGQVYENKTTPAFLIDGMDWKIAAWEYYVHFQTRNKTRLIMLWTPYGHDEDWKLHTRRNGGPVVHLGQPDKDGKYDDERTCYLGFDRMHVDNASVVVFHGQALANRWLSDVPSDHKPSQYWTYYDIESPVNNAWWENKEWQATVNSMGFNWVWSYSHNADVHHPYGRFVKKQSSNDHKTVMDQVRKNLENFSQRKFDAMFITDNCDTNSLREILILKLAEYGIKIESLGRCNNGMSPYHLLDNIGYKETYTRYRFYFAFENSRCEDFITQKVFTAYNISKHYSLIPVVYGAGDSYDRYLPKGSFVNAEAFPSVKELAAHLKLLSMASTDKLERYFAWQKDYDLDTRFIQNGLRNLCEKIWQVTGNADKASQPVMDALKDVAVGFGKCAKPSRQWLGIDNEGIQIGRIKDDGLK